MLVTYKMAEKLCNENLNIYWNFNIRCYVSIMKVFPPNKLQTNYCQKNSRSLMFLSENGIQNISFILFYKALRKITSIIIELEDDDASADSRHWAGVWFNLALRRSKCVYF